MKGVSRDVRRRHFRRIDNAFHVIVYPVGAPKIVFRDKANWSYSVTVRSKKQPANRKPRMLFIFWHDFMEVFFLDRKKEFIVVDERNPACAPSIGVEAVLKDIHLLTDAGPVV